MTPAGARATIPAAWRRAFRLSGNGPPTIAVCVVNFLSGLLIAYAAVGCVYWLWMLVGAVRIVRGVPVLDRVDPPDPERWPELSVVVPACNEAASIESAARTLLAQDYPNLRIVLVDDRSTDGTGEIVDGVAASDPRVTAIHVTELPEGWLGKVHALDQGFRAAGGVWVLLTDGDVHFAPGAIRRAVAWAEHRTLDHLAAAPSMWPCGWLVDAMIDAFLRSFCVGMRVWAVGRPGSRAVIGVGAFNLIRRETFERTDGFEWLRLEVADDVGVGLVMRRAGARSGLVFAGDLVGLRWYPTLADMARGTEKGFASVAGCRALRMAFAGAAYAALELAPWVALAPWGVPWLWTAGLAMLGMWLAGEILLHRWAQRRFWPVLLEPVGTLVGVALFFRTAWLGLVRGGVVWRGTLYPSRALREGKRVWLGRLTRGGQ